MKISIDESAGFCWGVVRTIDMVEDTLEHTNSRQVYVLGQIIHNPREIERLEKKGLKTITHEQLPEVAPQKPKVIIRAHGEPYKTYRTAAELGIEIIDATCPLVRTLQKRIKTFYKEGWQIVIFGKRDHAEVIGLRGVCNDDCIVINSVREAIKKIDYSKKTVLFSQTTMDRKTFYAIKSAIEKKFKAESGNRDIGDLFLTKDSICKYVFGREEKLNDFAMENDVVIFAAGRHSSNGKFLFEICKNANPRTHFIEDIDEIDFEWFDNAKSIGITGATSTPQWFIQLIKDELEKKF